MAVVINWSIGFETEEGGATRPVSLLMDIVDPDGKSYFRVTGRFWRSITVKGLVGLVTIPLWRLGYFGVTSVDEIDDLYLVAPGLRRTKITISVPDAVPTKMETDDFAIGAWSSVTGFNLSVSDPPDSPDTIVDYVLRADLDPFWSAAVAVADLPEDIPFNPDSFPAWQFGVASFDVDFTLAARMGNEDAGPPSDPVTKTITQTNRYFVAAADWSLTSIQTVGPVGQVDFAFSGGSTFAPPSPWQARAYVGALPSGADAGTLLPLDWATLANTFPVAPGTTVRVSTGVAEAGTVYGTIVLYNPTTGAFRQGTVRETVTVLALTLPPPLPALTSQTITGRVSHGGVLKADIGVQVSGDAVWTNTNGSPARTNRWEVDGVAVGSLANNAAATYTPVAGDDGKQLTLRSTGKSSNGDTVVVSAPVGVVRVAPAAIGSVPAQNLTEGEGPWSVAGATVAAAFSGSALVFSVASSIATINSSTGEITIPESAPLVEAVRVTVSNSGGSAFVDFTLTIEAAEPEEPTFPASISDTAWRIVEVRDPVEAGGTVGRRKLEWLAAVSVPAGFEIRFYGGSTPPPVAWSNGNVVVTPGTDFTTTTGLAIGSTVYPALGWKRVSDGAFQTASSRPSFPILGIEEEPPVEDVFPAFPTAQYNQATGQSLATFGPNNGAGGSDGWTGSFSVVEAYEAWRGRAAAETHLAAQLRHHLGATRCPEAAGGFPAQLELRFAVIAAFAKLHTTFWNNTLTATERTKIDLVVKALLIAGAYCCSTKNPDIQAGIGKARSLKSAPNWHNTNFNFSGAPPAIVHACRVFLGASAATSFLNSLNIANFITQLNAQSLTRTADTFEGLPNTGSTTGQGGAGVVPPSKVQVQNAVANWVCNTGDFTGQTMTTPGSTVAVSMIERCFQKNIETGVGGNAGNGWIGPGSGGFAKIQSGAAGLPNKGLLGMQQEFDSSDANGVRSALTPYVLYGTRICQEIILLLGAAGMLDRSNAALVSAVAQMNRGMVDIDYKSEQGYLNYEKGSGDTYNETGTGANGGLTYAMRIGSGSPRTRGYTLGIWFDVLYPWLTA